MSPARAMLARPSLSNVVPRTQTACRPSPSPQPSPRRGGEGGGGDWFRAVPPPPPRRGGRGRAGDLFPRFPPPPLRGEGQGEGLATISSSFSHDVGAGADSG